MIGRRFSRLRVQLVLLALAPLIPVLIVSLLNARQDRDEADTAVRAGAVRLARLASFGIEQRLEAARQLTVALAGDDEIGNLHPLGCHRLLVRELAAVPAYLNMAVVDARGRPVCAAGALATSRGRLADSDWFRRVAATGRSTLGDDPRGVLAIRASLVVATPLLGPGRKFRGAVAAVLDLNDISPIAGSIDLPKGASLTAFETGGRVLARFPEPDRFVGRRFLDTALLRAGRQGTGGQVKGLDGKSRVYGFNRVGVGRARQIVVAVGLSKSRAQAAADRTLRRTLITLLIVALIASVVVLVVADWIIARPIRTLAAASRRLSAGDLAARSGLKASEGEVGDLAESFDEMAESLEAREREVDRIASERQRLLAELIAAEEEERKRIAGDIHDDSIQALSALLLRLEMIERKMDDEAQRQSLTEARAAARDAVGRLRHLVFKLSPPSLDTSGLGPALEILVEEVSRVWGTAGRVESDLDQEPTPALRALVYRLTSEAVNNAAKHAQANLIEVTVESREGGVWVQVADDGVGFDVEAASRPTPGHLGLVSMRERAESAGGWWRATSRPGEASRVEFWVPDREDEGELLEEAAPHRLGDGGGPV